MLMWNVEGLPLILPVISFAFSAHPIVFPVLQTLQKPSPTRIVAVINRALMLSCAIYLVIGKAMSNFDGQTAGWLPFKLSFSHEQNCPLLLDALKLSHQKPLFDNIASFSSSMMCALHGGVCGYITFRAAVSGDLLRNYGMPPSSAHAHTHTHARGSRWFSLVLNSRLARLLFVYRHPVVLRFCSFNPAPSTSDRP